MIIFSSSTFRDFGNVETGKSKITNLLQVNYNYSYIVNVVYTLSHST